MHTTDPTHDSPAPAAPADGRRTDYPATLPDCLVVTATAEDGCIMGVRHRELPVHGVQFHPESIMTPSGKRMLRNFLRLSEA